MQIVKNAMLFENNSAYKLYYKTGTGYRENGNLVGWLVGWIEENGHPYFFVLNIESKNKAADMAAIRMKIAKSIFKEEGLMHVTK